MNIALIGLDTSHVSHFTKILNTSERGAKVVAAYPGGSERLPHSFAQIGKFSANLRDNYGVELVSSIGELLGKHDAFFITSVDAAQHPEQLCAIAAEGKPVYIDKPFAHSLVDAQTMLDLARGHNTPLFASGPLRFARAFRQALSTAKEDGTVIGCDLYGPMVMPEGGNGYFWYGIHTAEMLFGAMGAGLENVSIETTRDFDLLTVRWKDGRIGTIRGSRTPHYIFGGTLHTEKGPVTFTLPEDTSFYEDLIEEILSFLRTGNSPIPEEETLDTTSMLETAEKLRQQAAARKTSE